MTLPPPPGRAVRVLRVSPGTGPRGADVLRLRNLVAESARTGQGVQVDLSAVGRVTSSTVATLLWARRCCALRNVEFTVVGDRGDTRRLLRNCGILPDRLESR